MPNNPFKSFLPILDVETFINVAFSKGSSKSAAIPKRASAIKQAKRNECKRIQNVNKFILKRIKNIIQSVPNLDKMHPFYQELTHTLIDSDLLKKSLGKLNGLIPVFQKLGSEIIRGINNQDNPKGCSIVRRQYFARTSSILKKQKKTFKFLESARLRLRSIPTIDTALPSIVVAGYPNVGKSSLVHNISTANPEICEYPFTTKQIIIGVYRTSENYNLFQIIDTPGVLDRPMLQRNEIEKQSILALRTISNIVVFMIDPTLSCGYSVDSQISLFQEIKREFIERVKIPYIIILNKMDFTTEKEIDYVIKKLMIKKNEYIQTDAKNGTNLDILIKKILEIIKEKDLIRLDLSQFK
ncbi:MAG: NOG1 family protein [Promethearchaeota archaeon]